MISLRSHALLLCTSGFALAFAIAGFACSDSTDTVAASGADSGPGSVTNDGSVAVDGARGASDAGTADPCALHAAYRARCSPDAGGTDACKAARLATCAEDMKVESQLQVDSVLECENATSSCESKAFSTCNNAVAVKVTATPAQNTVRDHVCQGCGGDTAAIAKCKKEFFFDVSAGGPGAGFAVFLSSDTLAAQIDTACPVTAGDAGTDACQMDFYLCSSGAYDKAHAAEPAACKPQDGG